VLIPVAARTLRESTGAARGLDLPGLALGSAGLLGIVEGVARGNAAGWGSTEVLGPQIVGAVALAAFAP
jgi:hypothetical protein